MEFINNKGAMFGLDARIALAIFGALSVISGAALYSAIQEARVTSFIVEAQEIGKAWEAYYLDTSSDLPEASHDQYQRNTCDLIKNNASVANWKGPYLSYNTCLTSKYIKHPKYNEINIMTLALNKTWGLAISYSSGYCDDAADTCGLWLYLDEVTDDIKQALDEKIDNSDGFDKGKFRYTTANNTYYLYLMPTRNEN